MTRQVTVVSTQLEQKIVVGPHHLQGDEGADLGGMDVGPTPEEFVMAALGACTNITLQMYAARKKWPLRGIEVTLSHVRVPLEESKRVGGVEKLVDRFDIALALLGDLSAEQRDRLYDISRRCPMYRMLTEGAKIQSQRLAIGSASAISPEAGRSEPAR